MTGFLADTHVLIWWWHDDDRLSSSARAILADSAARIFVPTVCAWEIANKVRIGKLPQMAPFVDRYDALVSADGFLHLDLRYDHALRAGALAGDHRDPFDRLIAAQALIEKLAVVTSDRAFADFGCDVLW
ncbi:MAG: type II toxin-antitoxin system VapC family toxin [Pseudomonadota bacterium]